MANRIKTLLRIFEDINDCNVELDEEQSQLIKILEDNYVFSTIEDVSDHVMYVKEYYSLIQIQKEHERLLRHLNYIYTHTTTFSTLCDRLYDYLKEFKLRKVDKLINIDVDGMLDNMSNDTEE